MVRCQNCRRRIKKVHLDKVFIITLGNITGGIFYGNKTLYYHMNELATPISISVK